MIEKAKSVLRRNKILYRIKKSYDTKKHLCLLYIRGSERHTKIVCEKQFKRHFKKHLDLENPRSFSEKIQYLKLLVFPKSELVGKLADKYGVRSYVEEKGLSDILIPLVGVYNRVEEIPFNRLPKSFVAKKSNAAGYNLIVKDKDKVNDDFFRKKLDEFLEKDFGKLSSERHYSKGLNKIIIEPFLEIDSDYKFFVLKGEVEFCQALSKSFNDTITLGFEVGGGSNGEGSAYKVYYDRNGEPVFPETIRGEEVTLPDEYGEMVRISEILGADFPFVRIDLYVIKGGIYLSEMTFTPAGGYNNYFKEEWQKRLGDLLDLTDLSPYFAEEEEDMNSNDYEV